MQVELLKKFGTWVDVKYAARTTVNMDGGEFQEPTSKWKKRMLLAEHSPIRKLIFNWKWRDLMSWISVHFVRHKIGIEHWVQSQRPDRTGGERSSQDALIDHECEANTQAIINISRKRLCTRARPETRTTWEEFLLTLKKTEPELYDVCVPDCIYRGYCYEMESCGFYLTEAYEEQLNTYREGVRD